MLASTMQFSNTNQTHPPHEPPTPTTRRETVWPRQAPEQPIQRNTPHACCLRTQQCAEPGLTQRPHASELVLAVSQTKENEQPQNQRPSEAPAASAVHRTVAPLSTETIVLLLRKEVIQPHLPVRLPCYDFVPIASPTFDHSPPKGLGHGLRVLPTFVT